MAQGTVILGGVYFGATWWIQLNNLGSVVMWAVSIITVTACWHLFCLFLRSSFYFNLIIHISPLNWCFYSHMCWCYSKKDSSVRHTELLSHVSSSVTAWLSTNCRQLMKDHHKHCLVLSVITHCNSTYHSRPPRCCWNAMCYLSMNRFGVVFLAFLSSSFVPSVHTLQGKWLELSPPKSAQIQCMAGHWHALTLR